MTAEADAHRQCAAFYADQTRNPDLLPYVGPEDTLQRFLDGAVVTREGLATDESLFTVRSLLPAQMKRLRWMLDHAST